MTLSLSHHTTQSTSVSRQGDFDRGKHFGTMAFILSMLSVISGFIAHFIGWLLFAILLPYAVYCHSGYYPQLCY